jgi:hypothetical protein
MKVKKAPRENAAMIRPVALELSPSRNMETAFLLVLDKRILAKNSHTGAAQANC